MRISSFFIPPCYRPFQADRSPNGDLLTVLQELRLEFHGATDLVRTVTNPRPGGPAVTFAPSAAPSSTMTPGTLRASSPRRVRCDRIRSRRLERELSLGSMAKPLVAILSGAGISTDSGIPDYRGPNGLWTRHPDYEKLVTIDYYLADPEIRRRSWLLRREMFDLDPQPNDAHRAIAALSEAGAAAVRVITQNVDGLHQAAGMPGRKVLELHGTSRTVVCTQCGDRTPISDAFTRIDAGEDDPPCLKCGGILKTATVMFGEGLDPDVLASAAAIAKACTVMFAVGTSLQVYPAAGLVAIAASAGTRLIIVNAEPTPYDDIAAEVVREPISKALPRLLCTLTYSG